MKAKTLTGIPITRDDIKVGDNLFITFPNNRRYLVLVTDKTSKYFTGAEMLKTKRSDTPVSDISIQSSLLKYYQFLLFLT